MYVVGAATNAEILRNYSGYKTPAHNCVLRVKAGERSFDPDYFLDLTEIVRSTAIEIVKLFDDEHILVQFWDPKEPFPEFTDDYYSAPNFKTLKIDLATGDAEPLAIFPKGNLSSYVDFNVDGVNYYPRYEKRSGEQFGTGTYLQRIEKGELKSAFHSIGAVNYIARIR